MRNNGSERNLPAEGFSCVRKIHSPLVACASALLRCQKCNDPKNLSSSSVFSEWPQQGKCGQPSSRFDIIDGIECFDACGWFVCSLYVYSNSKWRRGTPPDPVCWFAVLKGLEELAAGYSYSYWFPSCSDSVLRTVRQTREENLCHGLDRGLLAATACLLAIILVVQSGVCLVVG